MMIMIIDDDYDGCDDYDGYQDKFKSKWNRTDYKLINIRLQEFIP